MNKKVSMLIRASLGIGCLFVPMYIAYSHGLAWYWSILIGMGSSQIFDAIWRGLHDVGIVPTK